MTLWFTGWHSIHGATPARLFFTISNSISQTMFHKTMAFLEILRNIHNIYSTWMLLEVTYNNEKLEIILMTKNIILFK